MKGKKKVLAGLDFKKKKREKRQKEAGRCWRWEGGRMRGWRRLRVEDSEAGRMEEERVEEGEGGRC